MLIALFDYAVNIFLFLNAIPGWRATEGTPHDDDLNGESKKTRRKTMRNLWRIFLMAWIVGPLALTAAPSFAQQQARTLAGTESPANPQEMLTNAIRSLAEKMVGFSGDPADILTFISISERISNSLSGVTIVRQIQSNEDQAMDLHRMDSAQVGQIFDSTSNTEARTASREIDAKFIGGATLIRGIIAPPQEREKIFLGDKKIEDFDNQINGLIVSGINRLVGLEDGQLGRPVPADADFAQP